jgi:hypothetical protein
MLTVSKSAFFAKQKLPFHFPKTGKMSMHTLPNTSIYPTLRVDDALAQSLRVELCPPDQLKRFEATMDARHYLKAPRPVGDYLRQIVRTARGDIVAPLEWGPAAYALKDRDRHIGWSASQRRARLKLIVQNRRYLLLCDKASAPNLASKTLAAALRALPAQWRQTHGYSPLMAETFTDPQRFEGTACKAGNWQPAGLSAGYSRHRAGYYVPNQSPKNLWLHPFRPDAQKLLRAPTLGEAHAPAQTPAPNGTLPVSHKNMLSLHDLFGQVRDPRAKNTRYKIRPMPSIIAMALLAGRRDIAQIERFGHSLRQQQRQAIGLPRKSNTRFWRTPGCKVYYEVLRRLDNEAFAALLSDWLRERAGELPVALAMDGKMIGDHIGVLTLSAHKDNAQQACALYDRKEGTKRCEMKVAQTLLESSPGLEGKIITADPLHCQGQTARIIVERGGDYVLQIKKNQPGLHAHAQTKAAQMKAMSIPPFLQRCKKDMDEWRNEAWAPVGLHHRPAAWPERACWWWCKANGW